MYFVFVNPEETEGDLKVLYTHRKERIKALADSLLRKYPDNRVMVAESIGFVVGNVSVESTQYQMNANGEVIPV